MNISTGWLKSDIHIWISMDISMDIHIHDKPVFISGQSIHSDKPLYAGVN